MNTGESNLQEAVITVSGMGCSSCAARVEKALKSHAGVKNAQVALADEKVYVTYDKSAVSLDELEASIERAGYTVERT